MPCGWEGNRRSGVALAMRHRLQWFIQLRAHCLDKDMSTPPTLSCTVWPIYLLPVCRNGWADRGAVWGMDSGGPCFVVIKWIIERLKNCGFDSVPTRANGRPIEPCIMWRPGSPWGKRILGASPAHCDVYEMSSIGPMLFDRWQQ